MERFDKIFIAGKWYTIVSNGSDSPLFIAAKNGNRYYFDIHDWKFIAGSLSHSPLLNEQ